MAGSLAANLMTSLLRILVLCNHESTPGRPNIRKGGAVASSVGLA